MPFVASLDLRPQVDLPSAGSAAAGLARLKRLSTGRSESIEIEMTEIEHEPDSCHSPSAGVLRTSEYAGSREGATAMSHKRVQLQLSCCIHQAGLCFCGSTAEAHFHTLRHTMNCAVIWLCCCMQGGQWMTG